jgi:SAM-dependent methyltransferase
VSREQRAAYDLALWRARSAAYPPAEFAGQESFMTASEIASLATRAGITPGTSVLDLCCGVAGPGRLIASRLGCTYLGVDADAAALDIARERTRALPCGFEFGRVPPVPTGPFDVVLLLETTLAFPDKEPLLRGIADALRTGGRFAFTVEVGEPLTDAERGAMPGAETVWPVPLPEFVASLEAAGLTIQLLEDHTEAHRATAGHLVGAFLDDGAAIAAAVGEPVLEDLLASHRLWEAWLGTRRVRKLAGIADRRR